ncbi:hypothetical protein BDQ17DRAFT_1547871 [Cyathus striatus]|nr:hypothetical protein BDQ17DRAFT_1547871 [Cyathus striatus]
MVKAIYYVSIVFMLLPLLTSALPNPVVYTKGQQQAVERPGKLARHDLEDRELHDAATFNARSSADAKKELKKISEITKNIAVAEKQQQIVNNGINFAKITAKGRQQSKQLT